MGFQPYLVDVTRSNSTRSILRLEGVSVAPNGVETQTLDDRGLIVTAATITALTGTTMTGHLLFTDATYDIGASGATRPRVGYFSSAVAVGTNPAAAGGLRLPNNTALTARNQANGADLNIAYVDTANAVNIGDGGQVNIAAGGASTNIKWGKPLVALGAGGAATLGLTGGSGPTTTTQNSWMQVADSTGVVFWVPAWK